MVIENQYPLVGYRRTGRQAAATDVATDDHLSLVPVAQVSFPGLHVPDADQVLTKLGSTAIFCNVQYINSKYPS